MRILQVSANWGHGGPGGVEKDIHYILTRKGHEAYVAYGRGTVPSEVKSIKIGNQFGVLCHGALSRVFDNEGLNSTCATRKLLKEIERIEPDIIQLHNILGYYINYKVLFQFLRTNKIPVVWTVHDCWPFTGHCINFERTSCEKWKTQCHHCVLKKDYPQSFLFDRSKSNYKTKKMLFTNMDNLTFVSPSHWLAKLISESFLKDYKIRVIHNGIDLSCFKPVISNIKEKYGIREKKVALFVASEWNEMKGIQYINEVAHLLGNDYAVVAIGEKNGIKLDDTILDLPKTRNVEELVQWYSAADVFVNPTLGDNLPTVNIEALACGTPVVTFNTGGSSEIAGENYGCIVIQKSAQCLAESITKCIGKGISSDACCNAAKRFDRNTAFAAYVELYESILNNVVDTGCAKRR